MRLLRTVIGLMDEFYNRYIIKHRLLDLMFPLLHAHVAQDNLLASALLEMYEFIRIVSPLHV